MYLDLEELPRLFDPYRFWSGQTPTLAYFHREDHLGDPQRPLDVCVRDLVEDQSGWRPSGPIRLLTHLRYFGYGFNPVSFYYCFDASGEQVEAVVGEVNNTPWNEQHPYVLTEAMNEAGGRKKRYRFQKDFHVSPFMDMDQMCVWTFSEPGQTLAVHMDNIENGDRLFDATMGLRRREISQGALNWAPLRYPWMTGKVVGAIYWQALKLWWKGVPVYSHSKGAERLNHEGHEKGGRGTKTPIPSAGGEVVVGDGFGR